MDPKPPEDQPQSLDSGSELGKNETGPLRKLEEAKRALAEAQAAAQGAYKNVINDSNRFAVMVRDRLHLTSSPLEKNAQTYQDSSGTRHRVSWQTQAGELEAEDGKRVTVEMATDRIDYERVNPDGTWSKVENPFGKPDEIYDTSLFFTDPDDPKTTVQIKHLEEGSTKIEIRSEDGNIGVTWGDQGLATWGNGLDKDPIQVANKGLSYLVEHASELKPAEPNQGAQPPPDSGVPSGTPSAAPTV